MSTSKWTFNIGMSVTSKLKGEISTKVKRVRRARRKPRIVMLMTESAAERAINEQAFYKLKKSPLSQLEWLLAFAERPSSTIETLNDVELAKLSAEVCAFTEVSDRKPRLQFTIPGSRPEISTEVSKLARYAEQAVAGVLSPSGYLFAPAEFGRLARHLQRTPRPKQPKFILARDIGDLSAHFVMETANIIEREGDRIEKCISESCGRLFVKRKRGLYCSPRCSRRERQRSYRKGLTSKERYEIRYAQYVKTVNRQDKTKVIRQRGPRRGA
jgi:hypothetical protein